MIRSTLGRNYMNTENDMMFRMEELKEVNGMAVDSLVRLLTNATLLAEELPFLQFTSHNLVTADAQELMPEYYDRLSDEEKLCILMEDYGYMSLGYGAVKCGPGLIDADTGKGPIAGHYIGGFEIGVSHGGIGFDGADKLLGMYAKIYLFGDDPESDEDTIEESGYAVCELNPIFDENDLSSAEKKELMLDLVNEASSTLFYTCLLRTLMEVSHREVNA